MTDLSTQTVDRGAATPDLYPTRLEGEPRVIPRRGPVVHGARGPLDAAETEHLERTGYLSVSDLVTAGEVQQMRDELERLSQDPAVLADERTIVEAKSNEVRTIFEVHESNALFGAIARDRGSSRRRTPRRSPSAPRAAGRRAPGRSRRRCRRTRTRAAPRWR